MTVHSSHTVDAIPAGARLRDESLIFGFAMLFASDEWLGDSSDLYLQRHGVIYLVFVYGKDDQVTLSSEQKKQLKGVANAIKAEWD